MWWGKALNVFSAFFSLAWLFVFLCAPFGPVHYLRLRFARYGHKAGLEAFLTDFGDLVDMDPLDPVQLDLGRYVGNRGEITTLMPTMEERNGVWKRGTRQEWRFCWLMVVVYFLFCFCLTQADRLFAGTYELRTGYSTVEVYPLFADPDGTGLGAGSVRIRPRKTLAYHRNRLGKSFYQYGLAYCPVVHAVKVTNSWEIVPFAWIEGRQRH